MNHTVNMYSSPRQAFGASFSGTSESYQEEIARRIISRFVHTSEANRDFERLVIHYGDEVREGQPSRFNELHRIIHDMGKAREEYHQLLGVITNVRYDMVTKALMNIETVMAIIGKKRHKILTAAAVKTVVQYPNFYRSHHFNDEALVRLAVCRSFLDRELLEKWRRLDEHVKNITVRLKVLTVTLANVNDLCIEASDYDSDRLETGVLARKNTLVVARMADV